MALLSELPEELLLNIFQNLKPDELVKVERVCQSFKRTIRRHQKLWRDGSLFSSKKEFCPIKYYNRFKILAQRNKGKFTKLFLNICLMSLKNDDIRKLMIVLPLIEVSELWIVIGFKRHCPPKHLNCYLPHLSTIRNRSLESIKAVVTATLKAIIKLSTLTKLRLSCSVDVGHIDLRDCGNPAEWPINKCKLEELHLIRLRYDILFLKR